MPNYLICPRCLASQQRIAFMEYWMCAAVWICPCCEAGVTDELLFHVLGPAPCRT